MVADNETKLAQLEAQKDRLAAELKDYKVRAHALLKKRDTELHSARDVSVTRAVEEKLKEAEAKLARALEERAQGEAALAAATQKAAEDEAEYERREAEMQLVHQDILVSVGHLGSRVDTFAMAAKLRMMLRLACDLFLAAFWRTSRSASGRRGFACEWSDEGDGQCVSD